MTPKEIIEICQQVDNLMCCVFSPTYADSCQELDRFAKLSKDVKLSRHYNNIKFYNGSEIRFIAHRRTDEMYERIAGLEIALAVMNRVLPTDYLMSRMRFGSSTTPVSFGLPKIVELTT